MKLLIIISILGLLTQSQVVAQFKIIVDANRQKATLLQNGQPVVGLHDFDIATGRIGNQTPNGNWSITSAKRADRSNTYGVNMPFCFRTNARGGGICMHEGPVYSGASSHGCIRVHHDYAEKLFDTVGDNWKTTKISVTGSIREYMKTRLTGLVVFDKSGYPQRFLRDQQGRLPDEFLKALHDGRITLFCENKSGTISLDRTHWFISLEFWPDKRSKGVTLEELYRRFGQKVFLTNEQAKELNRRSKY